MKKRINILIVILVLVSLFIFLNRSSKIATAFSGIFQNIFSSPKTFLYGIKVGIGADDSKEVKKLKEENATLVKKLVEFERTKRDNEALRSQFETEETKTFKLIPASVVGFLGKFSSPTVLIINKGAADGIKQEMAVVFKNNLVGKINEVSEAYARVLLPVNEKFSILGKSLETNVPGVILGQGDFILFDRVDINENIREGEILVTKGEINEKGHGIPPGLIIGKILSVNKNESLPFQTAKAKELIQYAKLENVFVVLGI